MFILIGPLKSFSSLELVAVGLSLEVTELTMPSPQPYETKRSIRGAAEHRGWLAYLFQDPAARGSIPSIPPKNS